MDSLHKNCNIVIAEDDEDDYLLISEALKKAENVGLIHWAKDGEELLSYLDSCENASNAQEKVPSLIILDFNMPKKDGREALEEIKAHPIRKNIPVIVLSTSQAESDIQQAYQLGANSFIQKPFKYIDFKSTIEVIQKYWLNIVKLPT